MALDSEGGEQRLEGHEVTLAEIFAEADAFHIAS
jgi:hypothetical protein